MIIIGFSCIGKSELARYTSQSAHDSFHFVDLQSKVFKNASAIYGNNNDWVDVYKNVAEDLSRQGYYVFVDYVPLLLEKLVNSEEIVGCVYPTVKMKDVWINRLLKKNDTELLLDVRVSYENYIKYLQDYICDFKIEIDSPNYNLKMIIDRNNMMKRKGNLECKVLRI